MLWLLNLLRQNSRLITTPISWMKSYLHRFGHISFACISYETLYCCGLHKIRSDSIDHVIQIFQFIICNTIKPIQNKRSSQVKKGQLKHKESNLLYLYRHNPPKAYPKVSQKICSFF
jgi:hypothetical protein